MKKLIDILAKEFGLEITNEPGINKYKTKYVFYPGIRGSLINNAQIYASKIKKDFVNVASAVDGSGKWFDGINYFDDYEKAKEQIKKIIMKIKEKKIKQKLSRIEKDF